MQVLRLKIGTLAQHSVFFQPYGKGKLRQAGALQSAQQRNAPASGALKAREIPLKQARSRPTRRRVALIFGRKWQGPIEKEHHDLVAASVTQFKS